MRFFVLFTVCNNPGLAQLTPDTVQKAGDITVENQNVHLGFGENKVFPFVPPLERGDMKDVGGILICANSYTGARYPSDFDEEFVETLGR